MTGHRPGRLRDSDLADLAVRLGDVLTAIESAAREPVASLRVVTAIAEGADLLAADIAMAHGWVVDSVLPFFRDNYVADFQVGPARDDYDRLLTASRAVFELPGERGEPLENLAYERVGHVVLAQSDLLLAVWDGNGAHGRGGTALIAAEAVARGVPVIHLHPGAGTPAELLWNGLAEHDLGPQTIDTVARGPCDYHLPELIRRLTGPAAQASTTGQTMRWRRLAVAYPLLLRVMGVRHSKVPLGAGTLRDPILASCTSLAEREAAFGERLKTIVSPHFARADAAATHAAHLFRSGYVANFTLGAVAVLLALAGLALPTIIKPVLLVLEVLTIGTILAVTHAGNRAGWHGRWLDEREVAERLRCLAVSAQVGELGLHRTGPGELRTVDRRVTRDARALGLPAVRADEQYLACVRAGIGSLLDDQIGYMKTDARRMHVLDHRLHRLGTLLFVAIAVVCLGFLAFKIALYAGAVALERIAEPVGIAVTIISAALPAIGAAIYGLRTQGDFAGTARRNEALAERLCALRESLAHNPPDFDKLRRIAGRATDLLIDDLGTWRQTYHARPLSLPG